MIISVRLINQNRPQKLNLSFGARAATALGISIVADTLDYVGAPIFDLPIVGDIADGIVIAMLYRLTGSKISTAINAIELVPFIGDLIPTYTITSLVWILRELSKRKEEDSGGSSRNRHRASISQNHLDSI
jgi:hypothetical protein